MDTFVYAPLDRAQNEIRLVRLLAARDLTSGIVCELIHASLDAKVSYEALSYTWGNNRTTEYIRMNGKDFWVTENLHAALRALRHDTEDRCLWIDAIAINQKDIPEKNQEVLRMLRIYENAKRVVVWLGDASGDSGLAMDHLTSLNRQCHDGKRTKILATLFSRLCLGLRTEMRLMLGSVLYSALRLVLLAQLTVSSPYPYLFYAVACQFVPRLLEPCIVEHWNVQRGFAADQIRCRGLEPAENEIEALRVFFSRSWFHRTWIVQEIVVARDVTVMCGSRELPWDVIRNATKQIQELIPSYPERSPYSESGFARVLLLNEAIDLQGLHDSAATAHKSLLHLIASFSAFEATDHRDKVYGLLGLSQEARRARSPEEVLKPDYSQPVAKVYADVVRYLTSKTGRLDVLRACLGSGKVSGLPSWTPDWTVAMPRCVSGGVAYWSKQFSLPEEEANPLPVARFSEDMSVMVVRGFIVSRLIGASQICGLSVDESLVPMYFLKASLDFFMGLQPFLSLLLRLRGVSALLNILIRCNFLGHRHLLLVLRDARRSVSEQWTATPHRTVDSYSAHCPVGPWENLVRRSFDCEPTHATLRLPFDSTACTTFADAHTGDYLCTFIGANVLFLVRRVGDRYRLVGSATVAGDFLDGSVWDNVVEQHSGGHLDLLDFALC